MAPRAQLSQERSRQRRDALLRAALDLFVEGGSRAVTHRAVAAAAGLPAATTTYYFATIDDLLRDALNHHIEQWLATMAELADADPASLAALASRDSSARFVADIFQLRPPETASRELWVILGAARDPELRPAAVRALTAATDVLVNVLTKAGMADPQGLADDFVAVIAGVSLRRAAGVNSDQEEAVAMVRAIRRLVIGHLVDAHGAREVLAGLGVDLSGRSAACP